MADVNIGQVVKVRFSYHQNTTMTGPGELYWMSKLDYTRLAKLHQLYVVLWQANGDESELSSQMKQRMRNELKMTAAPTRERLEEEPDLCSISLYTVAGRDEKRAINPRTARIQLVTVEHIMLVEQKDVVN